MTAVVTPHHRQMPGQIASICFPDQAYCKATFGVQCRRGGGFHGESIRHPRGQAHHKEASW